MTENQTFRVSPSRSKCFTVRVSALKSLLQVARGHYHVRQSARVDASVHYSLPSIGPKTVRERPGCTDGSKQDTRVHNRYKPTYLIRDQGLASRQFSLFFIIKKSESDHQILSDCSTMAETSPLYIGLDNSTQALKAVVIDQHLNTLYEHRLDFTDDLPEYNTRGGVIVADDGSVLAPVLMYVEAMEKVFDNLNSQ